MATDMISTIEPQKTWLQNTQANLVGLCNCDFRMWLPTNEGDWTSVEVDSPAERGEELSDYDALPYDFVPPVNFFEQVRKERAPAIFELESGRYLLAVPVLCPQNCEIYLAATIQTTDMPQQLVQLGSIAQKYLQKEAEIVRLEKENNFFLHQVSEDFESLTFLGFMAERLTLGEEFNSLDEILSQSLKRLGKSIKTHALAYVDRQETTQSTIREFWQDEQQEEVIEASVVLDIVQQYAEEASINPVIKNSPSGVYLYPGVQDFILVEVSTSMSDLGWLVAVNRLHSGSNKNEKSRFRLSNQEFGTNEASLLSTAATMLASHANNVQLFKERKQLLVNVVRALVSAVEAKDDYTCGHSERVALFAKRLAQQIGYSDQDCELLYLTGLLHDVGKIAVSDAVLNKTDALTEEEYEEIKQHPDEGWAILRELTQLSYVLPGVLHHHERYDGKGYPDNLVGEDIPLDGRILAVADAYDAMTSNRAYRQGMPQEKAEQILREGAGTQWDRDIIEAFFEVVEDLKDMRENYQPRKHPNRKADSQLVMS